MAENPPFRSSGGRRCQEQATDPTRVGGTRDYLVVPSRILESSHVNITILNDRSLRTPSKIRKDSVVQSTHV